ncbi:MAG: sigma-70 family RNA polymerase sigma factor [Candidatus Riflebacteria bacterium]|nr:sigma-70 family RNA polymerase sigma factor [Candidatus Riflebacteria bacterium]
MDEAELVRRVLSGEQEAYRLLVERHKVRVFNRCYFILGSAADAEDLAQETFFRAYQNLSKYDARFSFATWILTIARNLSLNWKRKPQAPVAAVDPREEWVESLGSEVPGPEAQVEEGMSLAAIREAIVAVQPEFREVLALRYIQELSYQEISDLLKVPMGTVKSRLFHGRDRLIKLLHEKGAAPAS